MEYYTREYWASGLRPSSAILNAREHSVSETGTVIDPVIEVSSSKGPNRVGVFHSHLKTETDPISKTLCFLAFRMPDDGQSPEAQ
jgi:hypothetical protein